MRSTRWFAWVTTIVMLAGVLTESRDATARPQTNDELHEFQVVLEEFIEAIGARDGTRAASLVSANILADYERWRDLALDATADQLEASRGMDVEDIFLLRVYLTRQELEDKSGKEIFASLADKGLIVSPNVRNLATLKVISANVVETVAPPRAYTQTSIFGWLRPNSAIDFLLDADGWRVGRGVMFDLWLLAQLPECGWRFFEAGLDPEKDPDCKSAFEDTMRPRSDWVDSAFDGMLNLKVPFRQAYGRKFFEAVLHHEYDPKYWEPMRFNKEN